MKTAKIQGNFNTVQIIIDGVVRHSFETERPHMKEVVVKGFKRVEESIE